jgi:hypothetical protein
LIDADDSGKLPAELGETAMISENKSSNQTDADILQCKADVLRSRDIMPPYAKTGSEPIHSQHIDRNTNHSASAAESPTANPAKVRDVAPTPIEAAKPPMVTTVNHKPAATNQHGRYEIPKFDLAEDIMAEQRRITAIKRKAPGKKIEVIGTPAASTSAGSIGVLQWPKPPAQEQIIAEIVARDIEKLCRGNILVTGNRLTVRQAHRPEQSRKNGNNQ